MKGGETASATEDQTVRCETASSIHDMEAASVNLNNMAAQTRPKQRQHRRHANMEGVNLTRPRP